MIRPFLILAALASLAMAAKPTVQPGFNGAQFTGLVNPEVRRAGDARLDLAFNDAKGGVLRCKTIADVDQIDANRIAPNQFPLWSLLRANCAALKKFEQGKSGAKTCFPPVLNEATVAEFPAMAVPPVSDSDLEMRMGKTLKQFEKNLVISSVAPDQVKAATAEDLWKFVVMARADFDDDGYEDLLVRVDWHAVEGSGAGSESFVLSKLAAKAAVKVLWRSVPVK